MNHLRHAITLSCAASVVAADTVGLRLSDVEMPHHGGKAGVSIWYPGGGGGQPTLYGDNPVFYGVDTAMDAQV